MAIGFYKPGQGYWTRVLTAVGLGVLALSGSMWVWQQLEAMPIRKTAWVMDVSAVVGKPALNQEVLLFSDTEGKTRVATGIVTAIEPAGRNVTVGKLTNEAGMDAGSAKRVAATEAAGGADAFSASIGHKQGIAAYNKIYLQAGVATFLIILATAFIYWLCAIHAGTIEFLIAVDAEMRKVNWSTRREVLGSTWVVIVVCGTITGLLFVIDIAFGAFFRWAGVIG